MIHLGLSSFEIRFEKRHLIFPWTDCAIHHYCCAIVFDLSVKTADLFICLPVVHFSSSIDYLRALIGFNGGPSLVTHLLVYCFRACYEQTILCAYCSDCLHFEDSSDQPQACCYFLGQSLRLELSNYAKLAAPSRLILDVFS